MLYHHPHGASHKHNVTVDVFNKTGKVIEHENKMFKSAVHHARNKVHKGY